MGVRVRQRNKSSVVAVGGKIVSATQRARQSRSNVKVLIVHLWEGRRSLRVWSTCSDNQWTVSLGGHEAFQEETWGVKKPDLDSAPRQHTLLHIWIFSESRDNCRPPTVLPSTFGPMQSFFFVHKFENHSEMSPISDDRWARRKFATGPTRYSGNRVPGLVLELQRMLEAVYREWRGVLWRRQVLLRCKFINKCFNKVSSVSLSTDHVCSVGISQCLYRQQFHEFSIRFGANSNFCQKKV
jgi:hypothetical protein